MLADNNARTRTFGFDSPLATRFFSAVKTGTSKDMRDNWTVGFTSRYTVGVWVGNADGTPMWDVSGVTGAAPVWAAIVELPASAFAEHAARRAAGRDSDTTSRLKTASNPRATTGSCAARKHPSSHSPRMPAPP